MYVDVKELSKYLSIKESTIYSWVERKAIPHYKVNRFLIRFRIEEIDEWLKGFRNIETEQRARKSLRAARGGRDIDVIVKKAIESVKGSGYNPPKKGSQT